MPNQMAIRSSRRFCAFVLGFPSVRCLLFSATTSSSEIAHVHGPNCIKHIRGPSISSPNEVTETLGRGVSISNMPSVMRDLSAARMMLSWWSLIGEKNTCVCVPSVKLVTCKYVLSFVLIGVRNVGMACGDRLGITTRSTCSIPG